MLGVIIFDSTQRLPIYWSPRMTREFVDGVLDVVTADRSSQFAYVMGPPSLYRGSVSNQQNSTSNNDSSFFGGDNNNNSSDGNNQQQRVSNALLHASLLSGVVESHHKIAQQHNSSADTGLIRPPHWPRLIKTGGTPLGRAAVAPTCPPVSRQVPSPAPNSLTKAQINTSKALNEGCVALSTNSPHSWLHPSVAPCSTEPVSDWILAHEPNHQVSQDELVRERLMMMNTRNGQAPRNENQQQHSNDNSNNNNNDELPSMFYFPWRIFGDSLGFVYCIFAPGPNVVMKTKLNQTEILEQLQNQQQQDMTMNKNENKNDNNNSNVKTPNGKKMSRPGSKNDLSAMNSSSSPSSNNNKTNPNANHLTNQSFAGFFGPSSFLPPTAASPNKQNNNFSGKVSSPHQNTVDYNSAGNTTTTTSFLHEENMPAVKQSMANLFVLLCDSFKTTKSAEAPTSKHLMANMDQVHECVEICCPGNGRCMPLFDTQMARKLWKMRNEH